VNTESSTIHLTMRRDTRDLVGGYRTAGPAKGLATRLNKGYPDKPFFYLAVEIPADAFEVSDA
jgi:hypothetical protein